MIEFDEITLVAIVVWLAVVGIIWYMPPIMGDTGLGMKIMLSIFILPISYLICRQMLG